MRKRKVRPAVFQLWLSANDPGFVRLRTAGRAALALLSIWLVLRIVVPLFLGGIRQSIPLFGVLFGTIFLLFIIDLKPSDRRISLWLAPVPFVGAFILASNFYNYFWLNNLILLLFFFFTYFFRRYGPRAGELALVATIGYYLGFLLHPPQAIIPILLACIIFDIVAVYLWEFVIIPYDPARSLHQGIVAFYQNAALTVFLARQGLEIAQGSSQKNKQLQRQLRRVHQNRRMIEGLFAATVSPTQWSQPRLDRLQEELFETERGLELLVEAAPRISGQMIEMPRDVLQILNEGLTALEDQLWEIASSDGQTRLKEAGEQLQMLVTSSLEGKMLTEWAYPLLRIGLAARQLAGSVSAIHAIKIDWKESTAKESTNKNQTLSQSKSLNISERKSGFALHPTTILGLQAVLSTGVAMLAAYLLNFDKPNLVYWTAFVVIAGSTGESLRRITMRVVGVITGTAVGVALAILIPGNLSLAVILVTFCLFMTIYMIPASYAWMVFWLNIGVLLIITILGGPAWELLYLRPVSTLIGAAIAALVVTLVLPIHVQNRFIAALSIFLAEVDRYIEGYVKTLVDPQAAVDLRSAKLNIDASYKKLELNLPNVVYEYNPLSRAQNRLAGQVTSLAVLKNYLTHLDDDVGAEPGSLEKVQGVDLICDIQAYIHQAIDALNGFLANQQGAEIQLPSMISGLEERESVLRELFSAEAGSTSAIRNRALYHLNRIFQTILQIGSGLGQPEVVGKTDQVT